MGGWGVGRVVGWVGVSGLCKKFSFIIGSKSNLEKKNKFGGGVTIYRVKQVQNIVTR